MSPAAIEIAVIAIVVSLASAIINKKIVNQKRMKEIKDRLTEFQKKYNDAKKNNDTAAIEKLEKENKEVMALSAEMIKNSFKPMLYTFVPFIIILYFLNNTYGGTKTVIEIPVFGELGWFWWYFLVAIISGIGFEIVYRIIMRGKK